MARGAFYKIIFALSIFCFLLLLGCTGEMTRSEKNLCYSLASKSYDYIPVCETENACFEKVNNMFNTKLGYYLESELYEMKNHISRSWFFYNKTILETKKISQYCSAGNYSSLAGSINQAMDYADTAFLELDLGLKKSFAIVSAQEKYLSEQKIDLIKEDAIYDSLVQLRQIRTELDSGATNSDSYVSFYLKKAESFNKTNLSKYKAELVEKRPFWLANYETVEGTILRELGIGNQANFAFVNDILRNSIDYFEARFYTKQSITALQNAPISELMKLFSDLGGNNNSSLKRFADLMNNTSHNLEVSKSSAESLWKEIENEKNACALLLEKDKINQKYTKLATALLSKDEEKSTVENYNIIIKEYVKIKEEKNKGALSLGEELAAAKNILNNFIHIRNRLDFENNGLLDRMKSDCDEKASAVKENAGQSQNVLILQILEETNYFANKTLSSKDEEKLDYCIILVEKEGELQQALEDYSKFESQKKESAKSCLAYLESVFAGRELSELNLLFVKLKTGEITRENLSIFEENCLSLKSQVDKELSSDKVVQKIISGKKSISEKLEILHKIEAYGENGALREKIVFVENKLANYGKYFDGEKIDLSKVLPVKEMLSESISETNAKCSLFIEEEIINYAIKNIRINVNYAQIIETNKDFNSEISVFIPNPFKEINKEFFVVLPQPFTRILEKDNCVNDLDTNKTLLHLTCLPTQGVRLSANAVISAKTVETETIVFASNKESLIKKEIRILGQNEFQKLLIGTTAPASVNKCIAIINDAEEPCFFDASGKANFMADKITKNTKITVLFYITGLISTNVMEKENEAGVIRYEVNSKNSLADKISADLYLDIFYEHTAKILAYEESLNEIKSEIIDDKIVLRGQKFEGKQERTFLVKLFVDSEEEYYLAALKEQKERFLSFGDIDSADKIRIFLLSPDAKDTAKSKKFVQQNEALLLILENEAKNKKNLEDMRKTLLLKIEQLRMEQDRLSLLGLSRQAESIGKEIEKIISRDLTNENAIIRALDDISKITFGLDDSIKKDCEELSKKIQELLLGSKNKELSALKEDFFKLKEKIISEMAFEPLASQEDYVKLKNDFNKIVSLKSELDKNFLLESKTKDLVIENLAKESVELISYLDGELFTNEEQAISAKIIPPITQSRLKKLSLMIDEIKSAEYSFDEKNARLTDVKIELTKAFDSLKRQAIISFNKSIELGAANETLLNAKKMIDENKFADALFILSAGPAQPFNLPIGIIMPVLIIVVVSFLLKHFYKKKEDEDELKKKIILDEWKDN